MMKRRTLRSIAAAVCLLSYTWLSPAQSTNSQISGIVRDPSGASVAGAQITVANLDTGIERTVTSNDLGYYTVALLQPGSYRVSCEKEGFQRFTASGSS
jgi:hypothetical protein